MSFSKSHILCTASSVRRQPAFAPLHRSRRNLLTVFSSLMTVIILCAITYIGIQVHAVHYEYKISEALQKKEHLIEENKKLRLKIASLKSPKRIESFANSSLKLNSPNPKQFIYASQLEQLNEIKPTLVASNSPTPNPSAPEKKIANHKKASIAKNDKVKATTVASNHKVSSPAKKSTPSGVIVAKLIEKQNFKEKDSVQTSLSSNTLTPREKIPAILTNPLP